MRSTLKWIGIGIGGLAAIVVLAVVALYVSATWRLNKSYTIVPETVHIETDTASLERGERLTAVYCIECHAEDLGGKPFFDDPALGRVPGANLTAGQGGIGRFYEDKDWVQAIRHGLAADGRPLLIMPSADYYYLSDQDLSDIIAYVKNVPPVDRIGASSIVRPVGRILLGAGVLSSLLNAEEIDHQAARPAAPEPGVTVAYGAYLVKPGGCLACHGADLAGARSPDPASPPAPNLTRGGHLTEWTEADFITALRTGATPDGHGIEARWMPWPGMANYTDEELKAIWLYIQSLPPTASHVPEEHEE